MKAGLLAYWLTGLLLFAQDFNPFDPFNPDPKPAAGGASTYAFVTNAIATANGSAATATTSGVDTTGAKLIVIPVGWYTGVPTVSDSKGNTYTALTPRGNGSGTYSNNIYYCINPTVGSGHTFSLTADYPVITVGCFSKGGAAPQFDAQNGNSSLSFTTLQPGSVSPAGDNELFVSGITFSVGTATASINSSFTISDQGAANTAIAAAAAWKIQTSGSAENPTWTISAGGNTGDTSLAAFK